MATFLPSLRRLDEIFLLWKRWGRDRRHQRTAKELSMVQQRKLLSDAIQLDREVWVKIIFGTCVDRFGRLVVTVVTDYCVFLWYFFRYFQMTSVLISSGACVPSPGVTVGTPRKNFLRRSRAKQI